MDINSKEFQSMIDDGYTEKMIYHYFSYVNSEKPDNFPEGYMQWAHEHGFIAGHAMALGVNEDNYKEFVSDYDFYKTWPHNSWLRMWINDKLTLKYLLAGTEWGKYMPEYYYYSMPDGLRSLMDNPYEEQDFTTFLKLLQEKRVFACKPNNGTESVGFHKLAYDTEKCAFQLDGSDIDVANLEHFVMNTPNYIYTEYLNPGYGMEKIQEKIHTLRMTLINETGKNPIIVGGYVRFPVDKLGEANYFRESDKKDDFLYYVQVDMASGKICNPKAIYCDKIVDMPKHPDTGFDLSSGFVIPIWDEVLRVAKGISSFLFGNQFIGYDFGITDKGVKIMEINGLPGNMGDQWSRDVYDNSQFVDFIRKKTKEIDSQPLEERTKRRYIK